MYTRHAAFQNETINKLTDQIDFLRIIEFFKCAQNSRLEYVTATSS